MARGIKGGEFDTDGVWIARDSAQIARVFAAFRTKYPELEASRGDAARFYRIVKQQG